MTSNPNCPTNCVADAIQTGLCHCFNHCFNQGIHPTSPQPEDEWEVEVDETDWEGADQTETEEK